MCSFLPIYMAEQILQMGNSSTATLKILTPRIYCCFWWSTLLKKKLSISIKASDKKILEKCGRTLIALAISGTTLSSTVTTGHMWCEWTVASPNWDVLEYKMHLCEGKTENKPRTHTVFLQRGPRRLTSMAALCGSGSPPLLLPLCVIFSSHL